MIEMWNGKAPKVAKSAFVHPSAVVAGDVEIGEHSAVFPGAVIRGDSSAIRIGDYVLVEDNCVLHSGSLNEVEAEQYSPLVIGNWVLIGHGAMLHGKRIGNNVQIGMNACVLEDVEIGDNCLIAAGAVVTPSRGAIPSNSFLLGVPARIRGEVPEKQRAWGIGGSA